MRAFVRRGKGAFFLREGTDADEQYPQQKCKKRNVKSMEGREFFLVQAEKLLLWDIFQGKSIRTESLHAGQKCGNERGA